MGKYKIEKGFSPPKRTRGPLSNYPLDEMGVDDSFKIELENESIKTISGRVHAAISYYHKNIDSSKRFTCRTIDNYIRCWRIK